MQPVPLGNKAPIVEALLDIRVTPGDGVTVETLRDLREKLGAEYPHVEERFRIMQRVDMGVPEPVIMSGGRELHGYVFLSADRRRVVQVQPEGLTFSILRPYDTWEELRDGARSAWQHFVTVARPKLATRIAARVLNRLLLPLPCSLEDWLLTYPEVSPELPQTVTDSMMRVVIPLKRGTGIVTQYVEPGTHVGHIPYVLDVDTYLEAEFHPGTEPLWEAIDSLRAAKNMLFFGSLTERAGELFK